MFLDFIYAIILFGVKIVLKLKYKMNHVGLENVPKKGPAIFISNHTSIVDSFIIGSFLPRKIFFMAKSTEFESLERRIFFYISRTFPVRRYDIDPVSLRNAFRILEYGGMLGIYPEGERTWDGEMLPFRRGTLRFLLATGVPVIPAAISGAFQHGARWGGGGGETGNTEITVKIGSPINIEKIKGKDQRDEDIDALNERLVSTISGLKGAIRGTP